MELERLQLSWLLKGKFSHVILYIGFYKHIRVTASVKFGT